MTPSSLSSWAMRVGPSRLISTADVERRVERHRRRRVDDDVAAVARIARSASLRPSPSVPTSPAMVVIRGRSTSSSNGRRGRSSARSRSKASFLSSSRWTRAGGGRALAVAHQQDQLAVGHAAQQAFDQRRADEPGRPGDGDAFASERLGDHAHMSSTSLPIGREPLAGRPHPGRPSRSRDRARRAGRGPGAPGSAGRAAAARRVAGHGSTGQDRSRHRSGGRDRGRARAGARRRRARTRSWPPTCAPTPSRPATAVVAAGARRRRRGGHGRARSRRSTRPRPDRPVVRQRRRGRRRRRRRTRTRRGTRSGRST